MELEPSISCAILKMSLFSCPEIVKIINNFTLHRNFVKRIEIIHSYSNFIQGLELWMFAAVDGGLVRFFLILTINKLNYFIAAWKSIAFSRNILKILVVFATGFSSLSAIFLRLTYFCMHERSVRPHLRM